MKMKLKEHGSKIIWLFFKSLRLCKVFFPKKIGIFFFTPYNATFHDLSKKLIFSPRGY